MRTTYVRNIQYCVHNGMQANTQWVYTQNEEQSRVKKPTVE